MPEKKEIILKLEADPKKWYAKSELIHHINGISERTQRPSQIKKGDVIIISQNKNRPAVVIKVSKDNKTCACIPLSSTEDELNLGISKSRFAGEGFFSKCLVTVKMEYALNNFIFVYDNSKLLNSMIREMKTYLKTLI